MHHTNLPANHQNRDNDCLDDVPDIDLATEAGLIFTGMNDEGEPEFVGTDEQFDAFEKLKEEV